MAERERKVDDQLGKFLRYYTAKLTLEEQKQLDKVEKELTEKVKRESELT